MIRYLFDLAALIALSVVAWMKEPFLGVVFSGMSITYASQLWRTMHLLGETEAKTSPKRKVMAAFLALVLGAGLFFVADPDTSGAQDFNFHQMWQEDFIPIWIGMGFLSAVLLIYVTNERSKR